MKVSFERVIADRKLSMTEVCNLCCFHGCHCFTGGLGGQKGITDILPCTAPNKTEYYWIKVKEKRSKL